MKNFLLITLCLLIGLSGTAQDLLSLLSDSTAPMKEPVTAIFKTTKVINLQSVENTAAGVFDFKIGHRFGFLNTGVKELFGLDQATMRLGGEFGLTKDLMVGIGRSTFEKTLDSYFKWRIIRQSTGRHSSPVTVSAFGSIALKTVKTNPERKNYTVDNLFYTGQLIIGAKISDGLSLLLSPTVVHRNLTLNALEKNDVFALGAGGRIKLTRHTSFNAEYIYVIPDQISTEFKNSFSLGFDIETGGHVFQIHATNSTSMIEKGFISETVGDWADGGIHFGFNISRVFTLWRPNKK
ncbi:MAG: DUF5777 family beta-barrel protein [Saprospiraceae bacterium]